MPHSSYWRSFITGIIRRMIRVKYTIKINKKERLRK